MNTSSTRGFPGPALGARRDRLRSRARLGFSMVEVAVAGVLLLVAMGGLASSMVASVELGRTNEETALADDAARRMADTIQTTAFSAIFANWNDFDFEVEGLQAQRGDADGMVGEVLFPTIAGELREDVVDDSLGMPRDLNADRATDGLDHSGDYTLLPATIRLQWTGSTGDRSFEIDLLLIQ